jgi:hypothetical protein
MAALGHMTGKYTLRKNKVDSGELQLKMQF